MKKTAVLLGACFALGTLGACSLQHPSFMNQTKIQVEKQTYHADFSAVDIDENAVNAIAQDYARGGDGPVVMSITYDPRHPENTALRATQNAARLSRALREAGIASVQSDILPAWKSGAVSEVFVSFTQYEAHGPKGCDNMPGLYEDNASLSEDYKLGCGVDEMIARQVVNPRDLLGRGQADGVSDGRRATNVVEGYRAGEPPEALEGQQASEE